MEFTCIEKIHNAYVQGDLVELDRLWNEESPKYFIKFFPANYNSSGENYFLNHLKEKTIWLAKPASFNDPFDCAINIDYKKIAKNIQDNLLHSIVGESKAEIIRTSNLGKSTLDKIARRFERNMSQAHKKTEESIYVTCFSEPDNLYSLRMWGHYANGHCGVCAEYDFDTVKNICEFGCIPVKYTDTYSYGICNKNSTEGTQNFLRLIYNKSSEWKYEKEWRVAYYTYENKGDGFAVPCGFPKRIYLGCKIDETLKQELLCFCSDKNIEIFQMKLKQGCFSLCHDKIKI